MRNDPSIDWFRVDSLSSLDALVGRYITGEIPEVHWEDSYAHMRFESVEEGLEALREPYFQQFIPVQYRAETVLREVQVFSPYSTVLEIAWRLVEKVATPRAQLRIWRDRAQWCAAFGDMTPSVARTEATAICLAALRAKGLEVILGADIED